MQEKFGIINKAVFYKLVTWIAVFCALSIFTLPLHAQILPDQYEPDNSVSNAKSIYFNVPQTRTMHPLSFGERDTDLIALFIPEAGDLEITIQGGIILDSLSLDDGLREGFGRGFTCEICCRRVLTQGRTFRLGTKVPAGIHYIRVVGTSSYSVPYDQRVSEYTITVSLLPGVLESSTYQNFSGDDYEPDDSIFTAGVATNGKIESRTFHYSEDVDWLVFRLNGCAEIVAETAARLSGGQLSMRLWDGQFNVIETAISNFSYDNIVFASFSRRLGSGIYLISLTPIKGSSALPAPNPYAFRLTAYNCGNSYMPPIIDLLLGE